MNYELNMILDEEFRFQLQLLALLEREKRRYVPLRWLTVFFNCSEKRVLKNIEQINYSFENKELDFQLSVTAYGEIDSSLLNKQAIFQLRLFYMKQSFLFVLLTKISFYQAPLFKLALEMNVSQSKAYQGKRELEKLLARYGAYIRQGHLVGNEVKLRMVLIDLYSNVFLGMEFPFSNDIKKDVNSKLNRLLYERTVTLTPMKQKKLEVFIAISILRQKNNKFVHPPNFKVRGSVGEVYERVKNVMNREKNKHEEDEFNYLFIFLVVEGILPIYDPHDISLVDNNHSVGNRLQKILVNEFSLSDISVPLEVIEKTRRLLDMFHFSVAYFGYCRPIIKYDVNNSAILKETSFFFKTATLFFDEIRRSTKEPITEEELVTQYMAILITSISTKYVLNPIYICFDFSNGEAYTEHFIEQLSGMSRFDIRIQKKVVDTTSIYVSDGYHDKVICQQIICENPPSEEDILLLKNYLSEISSKVGIRKSVYEK